MYTGKIKFFNQSREFGFIIPDDGGPDVFFHVTGLAEGWPYPDRKVTYDLGQTRRGTHAQNVRVH